MKRCVYETMRRPVSLEVKGASHEEGVGGG